MISCGATRTYDDKGNLLEDWLSFTGWCGSGLKFLIQGREPLLVIVLCDDCARRKGWLW